MKLLSYLGMFVGLALMVLLVAWQGVGEIVDLLLASGWALLWLPVIWLPCLAPAARSWQYLFVAEHRPRYAQVLYAIWIGRAINTLLPVASIGGEVVKARLLNLWGTRGVHASASVVVDKTVQVFALIIWGLISAGLLVWLVAGAALAMSILGGLAVLLLAILGFLHAQRSGLFGFIARHSAKLMKADHSARLTSNAALVDEAVRELYRSPWRIVWSVLLRTAGLIWQTSEVWLAAYLMGYPIGLGEALMLKGLSSTLSDIAFFIPNSYGVQEGAYIALGALLGLPADMMLALSLATRVRELVVDVPGLIAWQHAEGRALLAR
ncbi:MAG: TIGR00374 family protein [Chromatiales bacterium]|jgi:putative membrane protein|nr:TIGR00374 family protein [Chromatiales bacterium]